MSVNILLAKRLVAIAKISEVFVFEIKRDRRVRCKKANQKGKLDTGKMLLLYVLLFLPVLVSPAQGSQSIKALDREMLQKNKSRDSLNRIGESFLNAVDTLLPVSKSYDDVEGRKDKKFKLNKYVLPLLVGFLLIKSILLPITLKALAVLSGKAVVLSLMSLILAAIIGLKKVAQKESDYEVINKHRRQDVYDFVDDVQEFEPYRFYKERRKKK